LEKDIIFGSWKARSLYRPALFMTVARELVRHKLYLVGVQEVRWNEALQEQDIFFSMENKMKIINWEQVFLFTRK
jgi:hypothetical protein